MKMNELKKFKVICLVSATVFSAFTAVEPLFAIPSAMISITPNIFEIPFELHKHDHLKKELNRAIKNAAEKTYVWIENEYSDYKDLLKQRTELIKELFGSDVEISNNDELISKTEEYRKKYSESPGINEIIGVFNELFIEEIINNSNLCRICLLHSGISSFEELKKIHEITNTTSNKVDAIDTKVSKLSEVLEQINFVVNRVVNSAVFSLVSLAAFLLLFISLKTFFLADMEFEKSILFLIVSLSYFIPDIVLNTKVFKPRFLNHSILLSKVISIYFAKILIHILSAIAIFSVFSSFFGIIDEPNFIINILFFAAGDLIGQLLVNIISNTNT